MVQQNIKRNREQLESFRLEEDIASSFERGGESVVEREEPIDLNSAIHSVVEENEAEFAIEDSDWDAEERDQSTVSTGELVDVTEYDIETVDVKAVKKRLTSIWIRPFSTPRVFPTS